MCTILFDVLNVDHSTIYSAKALRYMRYMCHVCEYYLVRIQVR